MPKPKPSRKIIQQQMLWPTPYWHTQIWEFMRSETRVTFNDDFTNYILNEAEKNESVINLNLPIKKFLIRQLWTNVNKKGNWNVIHQHGQYTLSGTYYVKVPKNSGAIVFRDPRPGAIGNNFLVSKFQKGELHKLNLLEGLLAVWPSYLDHFVEPNESDEERISISFDIDCI